MPTLRTLVSFTNANGFANGYITEGGVTIDAAGDLFGTANGGGTFNDGTVFEVAHTASGYAATPTVLVNFRSPVWSRTPQETSLARPIAAEQTWVGRFSRFKRSAPATRPPRPR
jgi:hypothetical protein